MKLSDGAEMHNRFLDSFQGGVALDVEVKG